MAAQVVEYDDIASAQRGDEELGDPGEEDRSVDRAVDNAGSDDTVGAQPSQECHRRPAAVRAGHIGLGPSLVDEDQALGINASLVAPPTGALAGDVGPRLLGGAQGFF